MLFKKKARTAREKCLPFCRKTGGSVKDNSLPQMKTSSRFIKVLIQVRISRSLREFSSFLVKDSFETVFITKLILFLEGILKPKILSPTF